MAIHLDTFWALLVLISTITMAASWFAQNGVNLIKTAVDPPRWLPPVLAAGISLAATVLIFEALAEPWSRQNVAIVLLTAAAGAIGAVVGAKLPGREKGGPAEQLAAAQRALAAREQTDAW